MRVEAPLIRLSGVTVTRDSRDILSDIDLTLDEHRIAIVGLNGSGKSTLVRLINGLIMPTHGTVSVGDLTTADDAKRIRRHIGFVFQNPENQIVMPLVAEDIAFGLKNVGLRRDEIERRMDEILHRLNLSQLRDREAHTLSGGEKQMVALVSVLVMEPSVVIFDEPTTMLDLKNRRRLHEHIDAMEQRAIVVTHDLDLVEGFDRTIVIHEGRVVCDAAPSEALAFYRELCLS